MNKRTPPRALEGNFERSQVLHGDESFDKYWYAKARGLPLAYFYADTQVMAEAIVTFWLLNQTDQRKVLADLKKKVFTPPKKPAKG